MTTDFRALCAELVDQLTQSAEVHWNYACNKTARQCDAVVERARAALADEPAVPDGREPASVTGQPRPVPVSERLQQMEDLAADAVAGLRYIEQYHGRLYGVGWDRVYKKADRLKPAHALPIPQQQENIND